MIRRLSALELRQARSIVNTIFPGSAPADLDAFFTETLGAVPLPAALSLRVALAVAAVSPLVVLRRPALLGSLSETERLRVLERLGRSNVYLARGSLTLLKAIAARACAGGLR